MLPFGHTRKPKLFTNAICIAFGFRLDMTRNVRNILLCFNIYFTTLTKSFFNNVINVTNCWPVRAKETISTCLLCAYVWLTQFNSNDITSYGIHPLISSDTFKFFYITFSIRIIFWIDSRFPVCLIFVHFFVLCSNLKVAIFPYIDDIKYTSIYWRPLFEIVG